MYVRDPLSLLAPIFLVTMMMITLESAADARHWRATYARIELKRPRPVIVQPSFRQVVWRGAIRWVEKD